jgi:hypothetical protein
VQDPSSASEHDDDDDLDNIVWEPGKPWLLSADHLRALGALDVPAHWRKTLGGGDTRDLFSEAVEEDAE